MFISRNNDADGWWAIGRWRSVTALVQTIDLREGADAEILADLRRALSPMRRWLQAELSRAGLGKVELVQAEICMRPGARLESDLQPLFGDGDPVYCTVTLTTADGVTATSERACLARPHDPVREQRRRQTVA